MKADANQMLTGLGTGQGTWGTSNLLLTKLTTVPTPAPKRRDAPVLPANLETFVKAIELLAEQRSCEVGLIGLEDVGEVLARGDPFEHETDGRKVDEGFRRLDLQFVIFAQATVSARATQRCVPQSRERPTTLKARCRRWVICSRQPWRRLSSRASLPLW